jgi:butyryl-CoA dehydrogenase
MNFELNEEQQMFRDSVRKWVINECPKDWCRDLERKEHVYPQELWDKLTEAGFHGVGIAEEYNGLGGDIIIQAIFMREFARHAAGLGWIWGITSFSGAKSIGYYGTEEQKQRFLPKMAAGELRTAISFSEPGGGTDVLGAMKTTAKKVAGGWLINGEKIWSTTADSADYLLLLARTNESAKKKSDGVSLFFVPIPSEGLTTTPPPKLGMRALSSCSVHLQDVFVGDELLLGEEGKVWAQTTKTLNNERIMMSAMCLGMLDGILEDAVEYMNIRKAFDKFIGEFQSLQHYVADIAIWRKQTELMLLNAVWSQSQDKPCEWKPL